MKGTFETTGQIAQMPNGEKCAVIRAQTGERQLLFYVLGIMGHGADEADVAKWTAEVMREIGADTADGFAYNNDTGESFELKARPEPATHDGGARSEAEMREADRITERIIANASGGELPPDKLKLEPTLERAAKLAALSVIATALGLPDMAESKEAPSIPALLAWVDLVMTVALDVIVRAGEAGVSARSHAEAEAALSGFFAKLAGKEGLTKPDPER